MTHAHTVPFPIALIGIFVGVVSMIPTKASTALVLAAPLMLSLCLDSNTNDKPLFRYRDFSRRGQRGHFVPPENIFASSELCLKWLNDKINFIT